MSSTALENIRLNHEYAELYERAICDELDSKPQGQKAKTWQQNKIAKLLDAMTTANGALLASYEDKDDILKEELSTIRGPQMFTSFYEALNATREYHQKFPNLPVNDPLHSISDVNVMFSGEEVFGKYLDLNELFPRYCNLPGVPSKDQDYLQYLDKFNSFFYIPETSKSSKAYTTYVADLYNYLEGFLKRVQPLVDIGEYVSEWSRSFNAKWSAGTIPGWKLKAAEVVSADTAQPLRLGMFNDASELEALGGDRLKEALVAMGLKCGGTPKERADRLWSVRGKKPQDYPAKLLVKRQSTATDDENGLSNRSVAGSTERGEDKHVSNDNRKQTAWIEYKIVALCDLMMDIVTSTRRHAEKQQSRTAEEKEAEIYEEEMGLLPDLGGDNEAGAGGVDDDDEPIYNPLNIPLGWDGKPIPYWLYKLHGLGIEYKCEICGNQSYWGRKAFDRHFQEWRHAHGMRCLGVPNTKHFHDITLIEDALTLYVKIKDSITNEQFVGDVHEEFEDSHGNVLNRRTFEDLARQGLL